ncbi:MAG: hypothetical protein MR912_09715 [Prevotella sp.]|nr:hypothetical protein [Prevotella sp.]
MKSEERKIALTHCGGFWLSSIVFLLSSIGFLTFFFLLFSFLLFSFALLVRVMRAILWLGGYN